MPRRSRRQSSPSVGKSRAFSNPSNVRSTRVDTRFDYPSPVERRKFLDEGNKALRALLARDVGYQRARSHAERPVSKGPGRPRPFTLSPPATAARIRSVFALDLGSVPTFRKIRDAVVCAKRKVRRELVFASGAGGLSRNVKDRASPSKVRC